MPGHRFRYDEGVVLALRPGGLDCPCTAPTVLVRGVPTQTWGMRLGSPADVHSGEGRGLATGDSSAQLEAGTTVWGVVRLGGAARVGELLVGSMCKGEACWVSSARPEKVLGNVLAQEQALRPGLRPCLCLLGAV